MKVVLKVASNVGSSIPRIGSALSTLARKFEQLPKSMDKAVQKLKEVVRKITDRTQTSFIFKANQTLQVKDEVWAKIKRSFNDVNKSFENMQKKISG